MNPRARRIILYGGLALWGAGVAFLTLTSNGGSSGRAQTTFCIFCGTRGLADVVSNWILFIPLGLIVGCLRSFRAAVIASVVVTFAIELLQAQLPGRVSSVNDIMMNSLGGITGAWIAWNAFSRTASVVAVTLGAGVWLLPAALLGPNITDRPLFGHIDSPKPGVYDYAGEVVSARVGGIELQPTELDDAPAVRSALLDRSPIVVDIVAGAPPPALAELVAIYDSRRRRQLMVGLVGNDLLVRVRNHATEWRLDYPDARWPGAFDGVSVGDTVTVRIDRSVASVCMNVNERSRCRLAPGPGDGWGFLLNLEGGSSAIRLLMALFWSAGIGGVLGLSATSVRRGALIGFSIGLAGLVAGFLAADLRPAPIHAGLLAGAAIAGALVRPRAHALLAYLRSPDA